MKNLIICLLFSCSFLLGNFTLANCELNGVTEVMIVASKTGHSVSSFELPKGFQPKNNTVEVIVTQGKGIVVYSKVSNNFTIALPSKLLGTFYLTVKVGGFVFEQKISI